MKKNEMKTKILNFFNAKSLSELRCYIVNSGNDPEVEIFKKKDIIKTYTSYRDYIRYGQNWDVIDSSRVIHLSEYGRNSGIGSDFNFDELLNFAKENIQHFDKAVDL